MVVVGLDFGTHQTKICVEDRSDKINPRYKFFTFRDLKGKEQIVLPSVIQINEDDTISYGFVDESKCLIKANSFHRMKPSKPIVQKPDLILPEKPKKPKLPSKPSDRLQDWKEKLFTLTMNKGKNPELEKWENECKRLNDKYQSQLDLWQKDCDVKHREFDKKLAEYNEVLLKYQKDLDNWKLESEKKVQMVYRYFKQATFAGLKWEGEIEATTLSIWYLAFVLFNLEEKFGDKFEIQMGIPTGAARVKNDQEQAVSVLLSAYRLVEDVFKCDKKRFLATPYNELRGLTELVPYDKDKKDDMYIRIFPEAYASLMILTSKDKLESGMNLMVDIGGGTTDISFFEVDNHKPIIYDYQSISKGINFIIENVFDKDILKIDKTISLDSEVVDENKLEDGKNIYKAELNEFCGRLISTLQQKFRKTGFEYYRLNEGLQNRPVVYNGGGSTFDGMRNAIYGFNQVRQIDKDCWRGMRIENIIEDELCPILSVALGLSVYQDKDEIVIYPIDKLFEHLKCENRNAVENDYNLDDD